nr:septum site-determining protein MinC [uncultured Niameybacter sp.]
MDNLVVFKGSVDGITVMLNETAPFEALMDSFIEKLESSKKFFSGAKVNMRFKGRKLSKEQQDALMSLLTHQNILNVAFIHDFDQTKSEKSEDQIRMLLEEMNKPNVSLTKYHYGIVRSGQHIDFRGSVVVIGDVNPGGVITADGNIIIMGTLNGKVHAGLDEQFKNPFILATNMHPMQIGIRHVIAQPPEGDVVSRNKAQMPQIAYVNDDQIYVEEIDFKTFNHMVE